MRPVMKTIRIFLLTLLVNSVRCQDGFNDQDNILRVQQIANDGQIETITGYSKSAQDPNSQSITSLSVRYQMPDDANKFDFNRERARTRKVYRIKNPFQNQQDETQIDDSTSEDSGVSASNQYAGMQYSLPPEEFLQQMRAENQYHQQQQQRQQFSTQAPPYSYTATPQPQYAYSTMTGSNYENQPSPMGHEPKSFSSLYNSNAYQYNNANNYNTDNLQSTPVPTFLSTPNNPYSVGTPTNSYVSSASPMYITSPPNLQPYVSSPYSNTQSGTVDYNNNGLSTVSSTLQNYDNGQLNKKVQVDQYGNPSTNLRYNPNVQNQYQNEFPSSTVSPVSSPYSEDARNNWQNSNVNYNNGLAIPKSSHDLSLAQYPMNTQYRYNQDHVKSDNSYGHTNQDSQRLGSVGASNNLYYNYVHSDNNQQQNNYKGQVREIDQQVGQTAVYSHGDYGWKLNDRKPVYESEVSTGGYSSYQYNNANSDNGAVSQVSFHMDTSRPYNYNQISKSSTERLEAEEFARAAAKAHDNYKQQLEASRFSSNNQYNNNGYSNIDPYYSNDKLRNKFENQNTNAYSSSQKSDYVNASPYFARENPQENKPKQQYDHDVTKNIVPLDVGNVIQNPNAQLKNNIGYETNDKYALSAYNKDQIEQNLKQYSRPTSDTFYRDKNNIYSFGTKSQAEDYMNLSERIRQKESSYQGKPQSSESLFANEGGYSGNKRYINDQTHINNYGNHHSNSPDNSPTVDNIQQQLLQRKPISDLATLMKFNDIPLRLTNNLNADSFRLQNNNFDQSGVPNPLPVRINQNIDNHHVDVATDLLNKLIANKQNNINSNRQETDLQTGNLVSTINGFKVANPFNIDLKLVADMLKGKSVVDESQLSSLQDQFNKPIKYDIPQLQQLLLKNENIGASLNGGFGALPSPYFDIFSNIRYPFQGIKYSRSEEEPENIPIAESSNSHPIGAVVEEDTLAAQDNSDVSAVEEESEVNERPLKSFNTNQRTMGERFRPPNSLPHGRHSYQRKYPKVPMDQPYPVLKPPPSNKMRSKSHPVDKINRKRRINRPKHLRLFKTEALFESNAEIDEPKSAVSTLLKPPPVMKDKSDVIDDEEILTKED